MTGDRLPRRRERFELRRDDDGAGPRLPFGDSPFPGTGARLDAAHRANRRHVRADGHRRRARADDLRGAARAARSRHAGAQYRERVGELPDHAAGRGEWRDLVGRAILVPAETAAPHASGRLEDARRDRARQRRSAAGGAAGASDARPRARLRAVVRNFPALAWLRLRGVRVISRLGTAPPQGRFYAISGAASSTRSSIASSPTRTSPGANCWPTGLRRTRSRRLKIWRRGGLSHRPPARRAFLAG